MFNKISKFSAFVLVLIVTVFTSCTTEFEKARTSNDPVTILTKANEYYEAEEFVNAQALYELAIQYYRGKKEAEDLFFKFAYTFYHTGEYISASHYFDNFASTFYSSKFKEEAAFMSAYSHFQLSPNFKLDQSYSIRAIDAFQEFINDFPESSRVEESNRLMDEMRMKLEKKAFAQGKLYYNIGQYQSAVVSFQNMLKDFPGAESEEEAKYLLVMSSFVLAENSVINKRQERYEEALKTALKYKEKINNRSYKKDIAEVVKKINNKLNKKV